MNEHRDGPMPGAGNGPDAEDHRAAADSPEESTASVPVTAARQRAVLSALGRIGASMPRARPRIRFEMPPESDPPAAVPSEQVGTDMSPARHPIHFGFMATVGVGFALLVYFVL
ncbi:MAG: hypothetical protein ABWX72_04070, partial [Arthrobacter sp.]